MTCSCNARPALNLLLIAVPVLLLTGCRPAAPSPAVASTNASPRAPGSGPTIQRSPAYKEASALFAKKDFRAALTALESLAKQPDLTLADRDFLQRQREICSAALGERGKTQGASPAQRPKDPTTQRPALGDCGPRALVIVAAKQGIKADPAALAKIAGTSKHGTNLEGMAKAAKTIGLEAEGVQVDRAALKQLDTPAIGWVDGDHFLAVLKVAEDQATIHDPNHAKEEVIETEELLRRSGGILLKLHRKQ